VTNLVRADDMPVLTAREAEPPPATGDWLTMTGLLLRAEVPPQVALAELGEDEDQGLDWWDVDLASGEFRRSDGPLDAGLQVAVRARQRSASSWHTVLRAFGVSQLTEIEGGTRRCWSSRRSGRWDARCSGVSAPFPARCRPATSMSDSVWSSR
jgi:hypothetical protein